MKVVVAYPAELDPVDLLALREIRGIDVVHSPYEESYERRTARRRGEATDDDLDVVAASAFAREIADASAVFALDLPSRMRVLAPRLRWVHAVGAGTEHFHTVDLPDDVVLTNSSGVAAPGIAEFVIARLLSMWKQFPRLAEQQQRHRWDPLHGELVAGKTVVIVGFGAIGQEVAVRAAALGMRVIGVRRRPARHPAAARVVPVDQLEDVLASADAAVMCASLNDSSRRMFGTQAFAAMPRGALFCNVSRGLTVDEGALVDALRSGHLAGAAIDVMSVEPLPLDAALWDVPNLLISPHCASSGGRSNLQAALALFAENLRRWTEQRPLLNLVN